MKVKTEVRGAQGLTKLLAITLPEKAERKANGRAVTVSSRIVAKAIAAAAPERFGTLRLSIGRKLKKYRWKGGQMSVAIVGARRSVSMTLRGKNHIPANYAHLVEEGHGGPRPAAAHPFAVPAYEQAKQKAMEASADAYRESLIKSAKGK